ncbi:MAG TPA: WD40 repeat domain-containing protein [Urbifossiella sp.]|jgi:WD40 repeat protein|nr:WD40 repeat domain-containing protein [Urbifossiella sp.]
MTARLTLTAVFAAAALATTVSAQWPVASRRLDAHGDPLPPAAVARLGTARMRIPEGFESADLTPNGRFLVASCVEGLVAFDVTTGKRVGRVGPPNPPDSHPDGPRPRVLFADDGRRAASIWPGEVVVWDVAAGRELARAQYGTHSPVADGMDTVALSADGAVVVLGGHTWEKTAREPAGVLVWDATRNEKRAELKTLNNWNVCVAVSADGAVIATQSRYSGKGGPNGKTPAENPNNAIQFWDGTTGRPRTTVFTPTAWPLLFALSPNGATAAVRYLEGEDDRTVLLDTRTGQELRRYGRGDRHRAVSYLRFSPDGATLAELVYSNRTTDPWSVRLWNVADGSPEGEYRPPDPMEVVNRLRYITPRRMVAWGAVSIGGWGGATAWEIPSGKTLRPADGHVSAVSTVAFAPDGKVVTTTALDETLRWDIDASGRATPQRGRPVEPVGPGVWDLIRAGALKGPEVKPEDVVTAVVSEDRTRLAFAWTHAARAAKRGFVVTTWDLSAGKRLAEFTAEETENPFSLVIAPDNRTVVAGSGRGVVAFDLDTGRPGGQFECGDAATSPPVFSPDGRHAAVAFRVGDEAPFIWTVGLFDWRTGRLVKQYRGHAAAATCLAFSPTGRYLASGSEDTTVLIWDTTASQP